MDLVIQAPALRVTDISAIAKLANARDARPLAIGAIGVRYVTNVACRICYVSDPNREGIADYCTRAGIDHAFVAADLARDRVRLVAMDMDSTLITIECIDEIADMLGIKPQVAAVTAATMRGEIDFRESLTRRVALLAGLPIDALQRVYDERLQLAPGAQRMLAGFTAAGARTLLVSGGFTFFTDRLKARLGLDETAANTLEIADGRLTGRILGPIVDAQEKAARFSASRQRLCAGDGIAVAVGDGANDLPMLRAADVSVAYHAKPVVRAQATYAIDHCGLDAVLNLFA